MDPARSGAGSGGTPTPGPPRRRRFGEPLKFLPVIFVVFTIVVLWLIYVFYHCVPMLQLRSSPRGLDAEKRTRGFIELLVFHYLTAFLVYCYVRSILVHPGEIPDDDPEWQYLPKDGRNSATSAPLSSQETKKSGERRHCKWCGKYKPDRCHHCRVCKTCILKMDHHCPWIYNCVGFKNYKLFFLLLFYSVMDCHFVFWTLAESVQAVIITETDFLHMFCVFFGEALALFIAVLTTTFFLFHIRLMCRAMTTIEYCEKSLPKKDGSEHSYNNSLYDLGVYGNIRVALGDNPLLWFVPCSSVSVGDGLNYVSNETRLTMDIEAGKGLRRKTHQKTQRLPRRGFTPRGAAYGSTDITPRSPRGRP